MGIQDNYDDAVDATTTGEVFAAEPHGKVATTLVVNGDATYDLEVRERDGTWVQYTTYSPNETVEVAAAEVRLVISSAGTGTDEVYWSVGDDS